ncbi:MAG: cell division ATP-binding protein FtsE [bacterium]|nr:cell division ATP-binding protein FtsE [bacterium]MDZ4296373.1 cell division ATP-binding protein FtsE [Patescibacteria group bacterium]
MISFNKVWKIYSEDTIALQDVSVTIGIGEFVSLVGMSGAGKSTMVKLLLGEEQPTRGKVLFDGIVVEELPRRELPLLRRRIGTVFQDFKLLPNRTALENVAFAMEVAGKPFDEIERDVPQVLELVGLTKRATNFPGELSGGERQRVAIARALINRPDVIIADEPTGNLDPVNTWDIIQLLTKINELGTTVILATHDKQIIDALDRRVIALDKGKLVRDEAHGKYVG